MEKRKLGNTDLHIAPLVFGGNVLGWTLDEAASFRILDEFVELGFNTIDTADAYSRWAEGNEGGESETIIGRWLKKRGRHDDLTIITKVGSDMGQGHKDISKKYILQAADKSLQRLQLDQIDLYLTHWDDDSTPVEETLEAYDELIKAGKMRWIGASNLSPERLKASLEASKQHNLPRYEVFQPEYNLYDRQEFESGIGPVCQEHGLGIICYYALASGFLTGKYRSEDDLSKSVRGGGIKKYLNDRGHRILKALDEVAEEYGATPAGVSLAWLMAQPAITAPIASATKPHHLQAFAEAAKLSLSSEALAKLNEASAY